MQERIIRYEMQILTIEILIFHLEFSGCFFLLTQHSKISHHLYLHYLQVTSNNCMLCCYSGLNDMKILPK